MRMWVRYPWPRSVGQGSRSVGQGSGTAMSCGEGLRHGSDPVLLWLWHRTAAAALI